MRARQYMSDVVGGEGAVLAHHAKPDDFRKKFEEAHIRDAAPVKKFLDKIQSDKEGYVDFSLSKRVLELMTGVSNENFYWIALRPYHPATDTTTNWHILRYEAVINKVHRNDIFL